MNVICYACGKGEFPENTLEGIQNCQKTNPNWIIEMDLQLTKDGKVVLFHDDNLLRTTNIDGLIAEADYKDLQDFDAAYNYNEKAGFPLRGKNIRIPLLQNVFKLFPKGKFLLDIHSDNYEIVGEVIALIETYNFDKQIIIVSKYDYIIKRFRNLRPNWRFGASQKEIKNILLLNLIWLSSLVKIKADIIMLPLFYKNRKIITKSLIGTIIRRKKKIWVWIFEGNIVVTVDSKSQLSFIKNYSIDALFTSCPKKLNKVINNSL